MAEKICSREKEGYVVQKFQEVCHKRSEQNHKTDSYQGDLDLEGRGKNREAKKSFGPSNRLSIQLGPSCISPPSPQITRTSRTRHFPVLLPAARRPHITLTPSAPMVSAPGSSKTSSPYNNSLFGASVLLSADEAKGDDGIES